MNTKSKKIRCLFLLVCAGMLFGFIPRGMAVASALAEDTPLASFAALNDAINGTSAQAGPQLDIEAWNETVDGVTVRNIRLNADVNDSATATILVKDRNVILDLNGHTISGTGSYVLGIAGGAAVTVRDNSAGKKGAIIGGASTTYVINDQGTFHLESGMVRAQNTTGYAAYVNLTGSLTTSGNIESEFIGIRINTTDTNILTNITGGTVSAKQRGIYIDKNGSVTVSGGEIFGKTYGIYSLGSVTVSGGEISGESYGIYTKSSVTVNGGKISGQLYGICALGSGGSVTMRGGSIDASKGYYGVYTNDKARLNMSGGEIKGGSQAGVCIYRGGVHTVSGGTITGPYGITIWGYETLVNDEPTGKPYGDTTLTVSGGHITGEYYGISGNGSRNNGYSHGGTIVNIRDGANIHGVSGAGIYNPQTGNVNVSGGNVTGITGIEMRAGNLTVTGGNVTGHADAFVGDPNGNGSTISGAGIAVSQHTTKQPISITVTGGTMTGYTSFVEDAFQDNTDVDLAKVRLAITGGRFVSKGHSSAFSRHKDLYITGGMYAQPVGTYTSDEYSLDYLGYLTPAEMEKIPSALLNPTGKVNCIRVENSELPYHVGYLTGTGYSVTLDVGSKSAPLAPAYSLNGDLVAGDVACAAFVTVDDVDSQTDYHESPVIQKWTSGDEAVVTVDGNGVVTAVRASPLPVKITATLLNGETVIFPVTVISEAPVPQTGDGTHVFLWLTLLAVSYFGLAGTLLFKKRRSNR